MRILCAALMVGLTAFMMPGEAVSQSPEPVELGAAARFGVLGGSTVTSTGNTVINGDLGLSPGSAVDGFPPGQVTGDIFINTPEAVNGQADLTTAYNDAAGRTTNPITVAGNLGGQTLPPGLYKSQTSLEISSGDLTLDAQGDANAVWIFQMGSTLTTTSGRQVVLSGGAEAANVFWQVGSSATIGTTSAFVGTIMADQSITLETGATLDGRALARIGAVTLDENTVTVPSEPPPPVEEVTLTLPESGAEPNVAISIPITTDDIDGKDVLSFDFTVMYDPDVITLDSVETAGTLSEDAQITIDATSGSINVVGSVGTAIDGSGVFIYLTGTSGSEGTTDLTFANLTLNDGTPLGIGVDGSIQVGVGLTTEGSDELPGSFKLLGNYPNPFNPSTTIRFDLPESAEVHVQIFDILGRQVLTLPSTMVQAGADRSMQFDAGSMASGIYIYRVIATSATNTMVESGRMTLLK
ncbi:MAG: ice-binding family protein [Rhodothermales bacterium]